MLPSLPTTPFANSSKLQETVFMKEHPLPPEVGLYLLSTTLGIESQDLDLQIIAQYLKSKAGYL